jgi:hypothetical protein
MSKAHLVAVAKQNGLGVVDVAIGLAESSGVETATNSNSNDTQDTGYWQINDIWRGQAGFSADKATFRTQMKNGANNARMAKHVKATQGLDAWTVYRTGAYRSHMGEAGTLYASDAGVGDTIDFATGDPSGFMDAVLPDNPITDVAGALVNFTETLVDIANRIGEWITDPANWIRIAQVAAGGALVIGAGLIIAKPVAQDVSKIVKPL